MTVSDGFKIVLTGFTGLRPLLAGNDRRRVTFVAGWRLEAGNRGLTAGRESLPALVVMPGLRGSLGRSDGTGTEQNLDRSAPSLLRALEVVIHRSTARTMTGTKRTCDDTAIPRLSSRNHSALACTSLHNPAEHDGTETEHARH